MLSGFQSDFIWNLEVKENINNQYINASYLWVDKNIELDQRLLFEIYLSGIMIKVTLTRILDCKSYINYQEPSYLKSFIKSCILKIITRVNITKIINYKLSINWESPYLKSSINWHLSRITKPRSSINHQ